MARTKRQVTIPVRRRPKPKIKKAKTKDDPGVFPVSARLPGQAANRAAFDTFNALYQHEPWYLDYQSLVDEFGHRPAAYIAWASSPAHDRHPTTQMEFAQSIGLRSDQVIRNWRKRNPKIDQIVREWQIRPLMEHRRDVINALIEVAETADPQAHPDRKMFLQLTKDLNDPLRSVSDEFIIQRLAELERVQSAAGGSEAA
jgi:hypothetical protein